MKARQSIYGFFSRALAVMIVPMMIVPMLAPVTVQASGRAANQPFNNTESAQPGPDVLSAPLTVFTGNVTDIAGTRARLHGALAGLGSSGSVQVMFEYGIDDTSYGKISETLTMVAPGSFSALITGLSPSTEYHFRARATGSSEAAVGNEATFVTATTTTLTVPPGRRISSGIKTSNNTTAPASHLPGDRVTEKVTVLADPDKAIEIKATSDNITVKIPAGSVAQPTEMELTVRRPQGSTGVQVLRQFDLNAKSLQSGEKVTQFGKGIEISIGIDFERLDGYDIDSLRMYYLDEQTRQWLPVASSNLDKKTGLLTATTNHFTEFGVLANPVASGPGRVMDAEVNLHSGEAMFSYPIELPPGPGGFKPKVQLTYNSGSVDEMKNRRDVGSWVGVGWELSLGDITYDAIEKRFYLEFNGVSSQLVASDDGMYIATNPDNRYQITRPTGTYFELRDRDGNYYQFGGDDENDEQYVYNGWRTYTYRWDLSLIRDANGNEATVTYDRDYVYEDADETVRSACPASIDYGSMHVVFTSDWDEEDPYDDSPLRTDNPRSTEANLVRIIENRHLDSIEVMADTTLVRKYSFSYLYPSARTQSNEHGGIYYAGEMTLDEIQMWGSDGETPITDPDPLLSFSYDSLNIHRHSDDEDSYEGNPGNPADLTRSFLTAVTSGFGGTTTFEYEQTPDTDAPDIWTRQVVTSRTVDPGIGAVESHSYSYATGEDSYPQYLGVGWDAKFRGFGEVTETDAAGNYVIHCFYTSGMMDGRDAERLTGREYGTQWYSAEDDLLREVYYDWDWVSTTTAPEVLRRWSSDGLSDGVVGDANDIACSDDGYVWVADGNTVKKFDAHGNLVFHMGSTAGDGNYQFSSPEGLAIASDGTLYVADTGNNKIKIYESDGDYQGCWGPPGYSFSGPRGVAVDATSGDVFVVDTGHNSIKKYHSNGSDTYAAITGLSSPEDAAVGSNGYIYVADTGSRYNRKYELDGSPETAWGGDSIDQDDPRDIAVSADEHVFVAHYTPEEVREYDDDGDLLDLWDYDLGAWDYYGYPTALAVSSDSLYVWEGYEIQEFLPNWEIRLNGVDETVGEKTSSISYVYDDYGNVIIEYVDGDISTQDDDFTIRRVFYPNTSLNILNKPARERVYAGIVDDEDEGEEYLRKETRYYYDYGADGNHDDTDWQIDPVEGNLTRVERVRDATSASISSYFRYDGYGNRLTETDANGNTTTWEFDETYNTYPISKTYEAVGEEDPLTESYGYDPGTTNLVIQTDVNGQETTYSYDELKRLTSVHKPLGADPDVTYHYLDWGSPGEQRIVTRTYYGTGENDYLWHSQYFDGLGRIVQTQAKGETGHTVISGTTEYSDRGLVEAQYVSQDTDSVMTGYYTTGIEGWKYASMEYDGLGRLIARTNADGTQVSSEYTDWQTEVEDENHHFKRYYYDAFQRLVGVEELNDEEDVYAVTSYAYDVLGNLVEVVDNDENTTGIEYDWLSRKTWMSDPDMGEWEYEYDANGNLHTQTDAKAHTITFSYDELNRLSGKTYEQGSGMTDVTYTYDSVSGGNSGLGKRTGMTDAAGSTGYKYDARGRMIEESRTVDNVTYVTSFAYDGADRIESITYPDNGSGRETVAQDYNGRGLPSSLSGSLAGDLVEDALYNQLGQVTRIDLGNGLKTTYGYYQLGGSYDTAGGYYGRLWEIKTLPQAGGTAIQDVKHTWDAGGSLTQRETQLSASSGDATAPAATGDLSVWSSTPSSVTLIWTAPGDSGTSGTASQYDVRYSTSAINEGNWASATQAVGEPAVRPAGSSQSFVVTGLSPSTTYYFAMKTVDEANNWSGISNFPSGTTEAAAGPIVVISVAMGSDNTTPGAVSNLVAGSGASNSLTLTWTAPGDDGSSTGTAILYDIRYSTSAINDGNWSSATPATGEPAPLAAGNNQSFVVTGLSSSATYYFAMKTADEVWNWSGISNVPSGTTSASGPMVVIGASAGQDTTVPSAVSDLAAGSPSPNLITLTWTVPGDDGATGRAWQYDVRYSTSAINSGNWASATQAIGEPFPQAPGSTQSFSVTALSPSTTYYFAIKTGDEANNWSAISNSPSSTTSAASSETETFQYDSLDRLIHVRGAYQEDYEYDEIGNIETMNGRTYTYGQNGAGPHAVTTIDQTTYAYDANGNMITRGSQTITWDVENRVTAVTGGASFVYDGDGNRVKKTEGGQTTLYVNKYFEKNLASGNMTTHYYLGSKQVAVRKGSTLSYMFQDHLGGTSVIADNGGNSAATMRYFSFGQTRSAAGSFPTDQKFTGQRLDGTGLYYYGARYYDPTIGRFISPDTIVPHPGNPQSFNRYTYARNNPLKYVDPTGHQDVTADWFSYEYMMAYGMDPFVSDAPVPTPGPDLFTGPSVVDYGLPFDPGSSAAVDTPISPTQPVMPTTPQPAPPPQPIAPSQPLPGEVFMVPADPNLRPPPPESEHDQDGWRKALAGLEIGVGVAGALGGAGLMVASAAIPGAMVMEVHQGVLGAITYLSLNLAVDGWNTLAPEYRIDINFLPEDWFW